MKGDYGLCLGLDRGPARDPEVDGHLRQNKVYKMALLTSTGNMARNYTHAYTRALH